ncbi:unnamed protein product, partial [Closterium sp. NIES-54]
MSSRPYGVDGVTNEENIDGDTDLDSDDLEEIVLKHISPLPARAAAAAAAAAAAYTVAAAQLLPTTVLRLSCCCRTRCCAPHSPTAAASTTAAAVAIAGTATASTTAAAAATMATISVLSFDAEGRPIRYDLYLLSDSKDNISLFDLASGTAPAPPATADSATRSRWLTHDATACLAIHNHLPLAECAHFGQHMTAQALYDTVVARYSSPATAALGRLLLPYLFPELSAFAMVEDLVSHLRASDARYHATVPTEDHFLSLDPTSLTVDLLEEHLLAAETSAVAVGASRGTPRTPFFEGCSPSPLAPSYASTATANVPGAEDVGAASASAKRRSSKGKGGTGGGGGSRSGGGGSSGGSGGGGGGGGDGIGGGGGGSGGDGGGSGGSGGSGGGGTGGGMSGARRGGSGVGQRQQQQRQSKTQSPQQLCEWLFQRGTSGGSDSCPYVICTGDCAGQTCGRLHTQHRCFSWLDDAWRAEFGDEVERSRWADLLRSGVAIFDLDFDVILSAMYALSVSAEGDCYGCVPPDPGIADAALGASESGTLPGIVRAEALHSFTLDSGASCCFFRDSTTLTPLPALVLVRLADPSGDPAVARSSTVLPCPATLLWHHRLGHPSLPHLRGMHSRLLVSGLHRSLPPLPPSLAPPGLPCVEGRQRAAPHSSWFPPTTAPLQTLHMDVWGPTRVSGQGRERYFLLSVSSSASDSVRTFLSCVCTLRDCCRWEGILQSFTLPDSPQQNGIAERCIGLVMEPRVSLPKTSPTLRWTGKVGDASVFRVWGSRAFVRDLSADKLSACAIPYIFLGFVPDAPGWQFYHPTSLCVLPSQDVMFDESVPFSHLFPYRSAPLPPPPLFLAPGPPPVDPLPPQGPTPSGVSQVDPPPGGVPGEVAVDSCAARGTAPGGAELGGAEPGGESLGVLRLGVLSLG